jgi:hypothetical protein
MQDPPSYARSDDNPALCWICGPDGVKPTRDDLSIYAERIADNFNNGNLTKAAGMFDDLFSMECWKEQAEASAALAIVTLDTYEWLVTICEDTNAVDRLIALLAERAGVK